MWHHFLCGSATPNYARLSVTSPEFCTAWNLSFVIWDIPPPTDFKFIPHFESQIPNSKFQIPYSQISHFKFHVPRCKFRISHSTPHKFQVPNFTFHPPTDFKFEISHSTFRVPAPRAPERLTCRLSSTKDRFTDLVVCSHRTRPVWVVVTNVPNFTFHTPQVSSFKFHIPRFRLVCRLSSVKDRFTDLVVCSHHPRSVPSLHETNPQDLWRVLPINRVS
jgi:hypothetical protein